MVISLVVHDINSKLVSGILHQMPCCFPASAPRTSLHADHVYECSENVESGVRMMRQQGAIILTRAEVTRENMRGAVVRCTHGYLDCMQFCMHSFY